MVYNSDFVFCDEIAADKFLGFLISYFRTLEQANSIDSTANLANSKVFLVHGADDTVVDPLFAKKIEAYYEGFNVNMNAKVQYIEQRVKTF